MTHDPNRSTHTVPARRRLLAGAALAGSAALLLGGCASAGATGDEGSDLTKVTIALDYIPGLVHDGLAYAIQEGLFAEQGIEVEVLPFAGSTSDALVSAGTADLGLSTGFQSIISSAAAGAPVQAIYNISPTPGVVMGTLADSGIDSPADFAGALYGGYGAAGELELINRMIANDGGEGEATQIVLLTGAQEALKSGDIDLTALYPLDLLQFASEGIEVNAFDPADYGVPDPSGVLLMGREDWLSEHDEIARGIVAALQQGYQAAIDSPEAATEALHAQFPDLAGGPDFTEGYAAMRPYDNPAGLGVFDMDQLAAYTEWALANGSVFDASGEVLTEFDPTPYVTNEYLPE